MFTKKKNDKTEVNTDRFYVTWIFSVYIGTSHNATM